ncbi:diguanylate cyclase domain-containing protein [Shewanella sp. YIC-542]|uniref:sensor domain-containing diguanylate cyclase n=1 Tax=Shewanella mytili TaxID=3377111 RepID=UPI00398F65A2
MDENQQTLEQLLLENRRLRRENARLEEKLNAALDGTGLCLWEQHVPTGKLTIFNMEWGQMLGFNPQELDASVDIWKSKLHPDDAQQVITALEDHLSGKTSSYEVVHRMLHKNGSHSWVCDRGRVVEFDAHGKPLRMMGTHVDITQEKRYELELAQLASSDPLTGLLNRTKLEQEFAALNQCRQAAAVIFIDLDDFKAINDKFGHRTGDKLLIKVASWLKQLAPANAAVARIGGDEFVLLLPQACRNTLLDFTEVLLARAKTPIAVEQGAAHIGFSIGVCQFTTPFNDFDALYNLADQAMYQIKKNGKHGVAFMQAN